MYKKVRYRIYPTRKQEEILCRHFGCDRFVYNWGLARRKKEWEENGINITLSQLQKELVALKKQEGYLWLSEVTALSLLASLHKLDYAYGRFYKKQASFPRFKKKCGKSTVTFCQDVRIDDAGQRIKLPKTGLVKGKIHRRLDGVLKSTLVTKTSTGKYYATLLFANTNSIPAKPKVKLSESIGVDLGLHHFIITSEGIKVENPRYLRNSLHRIKILQARASRKKKGSENSKKAIAQVAILHERVKNKREDFLQKLTKGLICDNQAGTIFVESLSSLNMMQNHKLALSIGDAAWHSFIEKLKYKAEWYGKNLIFIDRFEPTSKLCSNCGFKKVDLKLSDREWICPDCGSKHDRDINAAINIKKTGLLKYSGQGLPAEPEERSAVAGAMKQEIGKQL